ncbi:oxidoreductase [Paraburkholderia sp. RL18-103-BIB-C]|uniref:oxidoreductase n=1 Tax=unclassified Paraburkholderia TaxID=2615204 RepID=UPI0038BC2A30
MKTWFITGVSTGFGRALAETLISRGERVVGTLRNEDQRAQFDALSPGKSFGYLLDVRDHDAVRRVVAQIEEEVGTIDVLVNNAGYGYEGSVEEATPQAIRAQFDVNLFGAVSVLQAVLPFMRKRRAGHILNVTSMGGLMTFPGVGVYNASKFALEGINEALASEVRQFGIKVTAIEPGAFRTDWAGRSMTRAARTIGDYASLLEPISVSRAARSGKQPGDPARAALAMIKLVESERPPVHLLLGTDAVKFVREKIATLTKEIDDWESLSVSTDFPE